MLLQVILMLLQVMLMLLQVMLLPSMSVIVNCSCCSNRNYDQHNACFSSLLYACGAFARLL
jgi:hypothetical protein